MVRARSYRIGFAAAALAAAACSRGTLSEDGGSGSGTLGPGTAAASGTIGSGTAAASGSVGGSSGGSSVSTGAGGGQNCAAVRVQATKASLDLLVLLDASGSMSDDPSGATCAGGCGARSKWAQSAAAINTVVAGTELYVNWGLMLFGNFGADGCTVGSYPTVPVGPENASAIATAFATRQNPTGGPNFSGSTPTRIGVDSAAGYLATVLDGNRQVIVLATDGTPNCAPGGADPMADDSSQIGAAIGFAAREGFETFVVGVGSLDDQTRWVLDQMASAGGFPPPTPASSLGYYPVSSTADMTATLNSLVASAAGCVFAIPSPPNDQASRDAINVSIVGTLVPRDTSHSDGWDYTDPAMTHLQFYGPVCDSVNATGPDAVTVDFLCLLGV